MGYSSVSQYHLDTCVLQKPPRHPSLRPQNSRILSDQFLKRNDFVGNMYNANGCRIANVVNYEKPYAHPHTQSEGVTMEIPETKPDIAYVLPLESLNVNDVLNVVSDGNKSKTFLSVESIDLKTQTFVLSGNFAEEFVGGDSNARVMKDLGNNQLADVGFVLSIADYKTHKPFPGFEQPNRIRVGTLCTPENIEKKFPDDLFIVLNTDELNSTCAKSFREKHLAETGFFGSADQSHYAQPQSWHAEHVATTLFQQEKKREEAGHIPLNGSDISGNDKKYYFIKEGVVVRHKNDIYTGKVPRASAFIKHYELTVLLANRTIPYNQGGNSNITSIQNAWNNYGSIDSTDYAHFYVDGSTRIYNGKKWSLPAYSNTSGHKVSFDSFKKACHYQGYY